MLTLGQSALKVCFGEQSAEGQVVCQYSDMQEKLAFIVKSNADIGPNSVKSDGHQLVVDWNQQQLLRRNLSSGLVE